MEIDDRDVPVFPNFYSFCTDDNGLGIFPYPRQLALAMQLLGEYCPRCSVKAAGNVEKIPKDASRASLERNIVFLEFGVCPRCGARKHKLVRKNELNLYDEMDLVLGQRSGKALATDTLVYTVDGWKTMGSLRVGDTVFDMHGKQTEVVATSEVMHGRKCLDMEFDDGEHIVCDAQHQWVTCMLPFKGQDRENPAKRVRSAERIMLTQRTSDGMCRHSVPSVPNVRGMTFKGRRIVSVSRTKSVPVRCIQTRSGTYLCGFGMIPTHNSALLGSMLAPYLLHRWLKASRPQEAMGLLKSMPLVGTLCAQTFAKAQELLFQPFKEAITSSKWFNDYHQVLDHYEEKHGRSLYKVGASLVRYDHKGLFFHPSGPNKRTLRGPTRILSMLDEIGWFAQGEDKEHLEKASANEVYKSLGNSLLTVQAKARRLVASGMDWFPMAYACNISSPSSYFDKAMTLVRTYKGSDRVLVSQLATWDFNPDFSKSDFAKEFQDDPVKAERDFGANPPVAASPWMTDMDNVIRNLRGPKSRFKYRYEHSKSRSGQRQRYAGIVRSAAPRLDTRTVMGLDAGHAFNSFGLAVTAPVVEEKDPDNWEPGVDFPFYIEGADTVLVAEVAPHKSSSTVVNHTKLAENFIFPIIDEYDVGLVVADRWQSIKMLTDIEETFGIPTLQHTLKGDDFNRVLDFFKDENCHGVRLPEMEIPYSSLFTMDMSDYPDCFQYKPMSHLVYQFMVSEVDAKGVAQKGADATDDLLRALCISLAQTLDAESIMAYELLAEPEQEPRKYVVGYRSTGESANQTGEVKGKLGVRMGSQSLGGSVGVSRMGAKG